MRGNTETKLDRVIDVVNQPQNFTREGVLHAVAQFIACDDQVQLHVAKVLQDTDMRIGSCCHK